MGIVKGKHQDFFLMRIMRKLFFYLIYFSGKKRPNVGLNFFIKPILFLREDSRVDNRVFKMIPVHMDP